MKHPQDFKDFVKKCVQEYCWILKVQHYSVHVFFEKKPANKKEERGKTTAAEISVDRRYLKADIFIYPRLLDDWKLGNKHVVEEVVAHEISHIATDHMVKLVESPYKDSGEVDDAWESLTEVIGRLVCKIHRLEKKKR